ncbi:RING finger protein 183-like [Scleropages formosus]|uniref:RING finger protein 183-like n=1 Tax=Scleropages formosus TaxID=113540 RepID=A0A0P7XL24_SCLFO|nr:E3 ubiquitin-protein ligase RNF183 [Scleropages formosus]KPP75771.1 RING finger protein 183-like [Scleropages formosus]
MEQEQELELGSLPAPHDGAPDLECAVCFSHFNNVFRTPKMLRCKHTFCLECLARMNIKSAQPNSVRCPLCRSLTPLPATGLPKLDNNPTILAYFPEAMQRVCSVRFIRSKGRLQLKRPKEAPTLSHCTVSHTLDIGLPGPPDSSDGTQRLSCKPVCRAVAMVLVLLLLVVFVGMVVYIRNRTF